jgi:hypothetical protein
MIKEAAEKLFGWELGKKIDGTDSDKSSEKNLTVFAPRKDYEGGSSIISAGGHFGHMLDLDGDSANSDRELILKYRQTAMNAECDLAIQEILDGAIDSAAQGAPVDLNLSDLEISDKLKESIQKEFNSILKLFKFNRHAEDYFKSWYVDGRIYFHVVIDKNKPQEGIKDIRQLDSLQVKKVKEIKTEKLEGSNVEITKIVDEYFVYTPQATRINSYVPSSISTTSAGLKIDKNLILCSTSGLLDSKQERVISHLHKAIKPVNNLKMLEDSTVIYIVSRAPERRIFYVDVGNLAKNKAEQYINGLMAKYRNKLVYDANSGEIKDDARHMSMLEDFWMPRQEGGRGTEIDTLGGNGSLADIENVIYFQRKLYKALNVPMSRLEADAGFSLGRAAEISRDEVKFQRFVSKIRKRFGFVLLDALKIQLILKGIMNKEEWGAIEEEIALQWKQDNYFAELKEQEVLRERLEMLSMMDEYSGKFFSNKYIRTNILQQTDEDIERINKEIEAEKEAGEDGVDDAEWA